MVLYGLSIVFLMVLALFIWRNCQFGIGVSLFLILITLVFYFLIAIIMALALVLMRDACYHAERIAVQEVCTVLNWLAGCYLLHVMEMVIDRDTVCSDYNATTAHYERLEMKSGTGTASFHNHDVTSMFCLQGVDLL
jgi:hypothetical protein